MASSCSWKQLDVLPHHQPNQICVTRPRYRQGRKETAVKVYTINLESHYLLIMGVPAVGAKDELETRCQQFGELVHFYVLDEYPAEDFTEVYLLCYTRLQSARFAKRKLDASSFFGGVLHVCFAPEFETVNETRQKLVERHKYVAAGSARLWPGTNLSSPASSTSSSSTTTVDSSCCITNSAVAAATEADNTYIWAGKTYALPAAVDETIAADDAAASASRPQHDQARFFVPRQVVRHGHPKRSGPDQVDDSLAATSDAIRNRISKLSAPNPAVTFKRRKT